MKLSFLILSCFAVFARTFATDSCVGRCATSSDSNYDCQCNTMCITKYDDCCPDYEELCTPYSCAGKCDSDYIWSAFCQCNDECSDYGNCCSDYDDECANWVPTTTPTMTTTPNQSGGRTSCAGICGASYNPSDNCHCNDECSQHGNCCSDYNSECNGGSSTEGSCQNRCGETMDPTQSCQCNDECENFGDCCSDYDSLCPGSGGGSSSGGSSEILEVSHQLWLLDVNRAGSSDYVINGQTQISTSDGDKAPRPFFTYVNEAILFQPSYQAFIPLLDNYEKYQGIGEQVPSNELQEQSIFLDYFLSSAVGDALYNFLNSKGLAGSSLSEFKQMVQAMWFGLYSRKNGQLDTSGFEHVFVGEIKGNEVSGFHNWIQFYLQEKLEVLNYYGYLSYQQPELWGMRFEWDGCEKPIDGFPVGTTPEYEMAVLTLCHMLEPDSVCKVRMGDGEGYVREIQTWTWTKTTPGVNNVKYVASAYFLT